MDLVVRFVVGQEGWRRQTIVEEKCYIVSFLIVINPSSNHSLYLHCFISYLTVTG